MEALTEQGTSVVTAVVNKHKAILRERTVEAQNRIAQLERELAAAKERADTATSEDELNAARTEIAALREALDNARNEAERRCNEQLGLVQQAIINQMGQPPGEGAEARQRAIATAAGEEAAAAAAARARAAAAGEEAAIHPEIDNMFNTAGPDGTPDDTEVSLGGKKKRKTGKRSKKSVRKSKKRRHGRK